jgi:hypothetical protein
MQEIEINEDFMHYAPTDIPVTEQGEYYDETGLVVSSNIEDWYYRNELVQSILPDRGFSFELTFSFHQNSSENLIGFRFIWRSLNNNLEYCISLFNDGEYDIRFTDFNNDSNSTIYKTNENLLNFNKDYNSLKFEKLDDSIDSDVYILLNDEVILKSVLNFDEINGFSYGVANGSISVHSMRLSFSTNEELDPDWRDDDPELQTIGEHYAGDEGVDVTIEENDHVKQFQDAFANAPHSVQDYVRDGKLEEDVKYICNKNNFYREELETLLQNVCCSLLVGLLEVDEIRNILIDASKNNGLNIGESEANNLILDIKEKILARQ